MISQQAEVINSEAKRYFKKIAYSYANVVCTICNPAETQFFKLKESVLEVTINSNNCAEFLEIKAFEILVEKFLR